jgi:hypothetical protein
MPGQLILKLDPNKKMNPLYVARCVGVAVAIGLFVVACHGNWIGGLLWSGACLFAGALVGFLFGIPKTTQDPKAASGTVEVQQKVNTNLEDISDWMTKIFVGLGLSQIAKIPPRLQLAAGYIGYTWGHCRRPRLRICTDAVFFRCGISRLLLAYADLLVASLKGH